MLPEIAARPCALPAPLALPRIRARTLPRITEGIAVFSAAAAGYLTCAALLVFRFNSIIGDSLSRVANAHYVLFSRDPHLGAVGFVWNPLPSLLMVPFLPLKALWPALVERGFIANILAALFMAGSVELVRRILAELGVPRAPRLVLTVLFAVHPMILYAGANGMTEAPFLFFTLLATLTLGRWLRTNETRALVATGVALAVGYLVRYEAAASAVGAVGLVLLVTYLRAEGDAERRRRLAITDAVVVAAPFVLAFVSWAVASWLIVGHPFEQFSSVYGNSSQLALGAGGPELTFGPALERVWNQLLLLAPLLPVAMVACAVAGLVRRDNRSLSILAVVGPTLAFQILAYLDHKTAGWIRYYVSSLPMLVLFIGCVVAPRPQAMTAELTADATAIRNGPWARRLVHAGIAVLAAGLMAPNVVAAAGIATNRSLATEEARYLGAIFHPERSPESARQLRSRFVTERELATFLDDMKLPDGSVLLDVYQSFSIVLASDRPQQFVVNSDYDFEAALADPALFGVRYLITQPLAGGELDALNRSYASVYEDGAGIATLVRTFQNKADLPDWRIYEVKVAQ